MKKVLFVLVYIMWACTPSFPQGCDCYVTVDSTYLVVPFTAGPDPGQPLTIPAGNVRAPLSACLLIFVFMAPSTIQYISIIKEVFHL